MEFLQGRKIATRQVSRQPDSAPAYAGLNYRVVGDLATSDRVMNQAFWVGNILALRRPFWITFWNRSTKSASKGVLSDAARK